MVEHFMRTLPSSLWPTRPIKAGGIRTSRPSPLRTTPKSMMTLVNPRFSSCLAVIRAHPLTLFLAPTWINPILNFGPTCKMSASIADNKNPTLLVPTILFAFLFRPKLCAMLRARTILFAVGDIVALFTPTQSNAAKSVAKKLTPQWTFPFCITKINSNQTFFDLSTSPTDCPLASSWSLMLDFMFSLFKLETVISLKKAEIPCSFHFLCFKSFCRTVLVAPLPLAPSLVFLCFTLLSSCLAQLGIKTHPTLHQSCLSFF
ncbi:hypothetical protein BCR44DRAFT_1040449 [Catenaria anguillulae PL171]|uniref:Uncharacterized protein n=1 Tax=Catenaria anguillulae PL171 TaxID=765915 RepID=A0A1Y2H730_9FUNG|nr:hypothetical protein BCR44DRAFT_1040449 [Catenaria anguillulae PL171]